MEPTGETETTQTPGAQPGPEGAPTTPYFAPAPILETFQKPQEPKKNFLGVISGAIASLLKPRAKEEPGLEKTVIGQHPLTDDKF